MRCAWTGALEANAPRYYLSPWSHPSFVTVAAIAGLAPQRRQPLRVARQQDPLGALALGLVCQ